jgi:hypothetical protein
MSSPILNNPDGRRDIIALMILPFKEAGYPTRIKYGHPLIPETTSLPKVKKLEDG